MQLIFISNLLNTAFKGKQKSFQMGFSVLLFLFSLINAKTILDFILNKPVGIKGFIMCFFFAYCLVNLIYYLLIERNREFKKVEEKQVVGQDELTKEFVVIPTKEYKVEQDKEPKKIPKIVRSPREKDKMESEEPEQKIKRVILQPISEEGMEVKKESEGIKFSEEQLDFMQRKKKQMMQRKKEIQDISKIDISNPPQFKALSMEEIENMVPQGDQEESKEYDGAFIPDINDVNEIEESHTKDHLGDEGEDKVEGAEDVFKWI